MRINIELARSHGLEIDIRKQGKDDFLIIHPIAGAPIESINDLVKELQERFDLSPKLAESTGDDVFRLVSNTILWNKLKSIDNDTYD